MNRWYALAALAASTTFLVHVALGGRALARPLLASTELHRVVKLTHYYCWHLVSIALALIALGLWLAAADPSLRPFGVAATLTAALFGLLNVAYALAFRLGPRRLPQWILFLAITLPGLLA
jgi:hypothetical protein